jgi:hypothetical protein
MRMNYLAATLALAAGLAMAQKPKSQKETEAVRAVMSANTPDAKIAAVEDLLTRYKDTEFKSYALTQAAQAEQAKGDQIAGINYANRAIDADKKNFQAHILLAQLTIQGTHEFDLDKDQKVATVSKAANEALADLKSAPKPNPALSDDQWEGIKKDFASQAHEALGMAAALDKKLDVAVTEYKAALDNPMPDPGTMVRLASVYDDQGKYDDGAALLDKVAASSAPDVFKKAAQNEKQRAEKLKAIKK